MTTLARNGARWIPAIAFAAILQVPGMAQQGGFPPMGQGPGGRGGFGGMQQEIKLVKQFDTDGDKILNSAERKAALAYL